MYPPRNGGIFAQTFTLQLAHLLFVTTITSACAQYAILRGFCRDSRSGNVIVPLLHLSVMFYVESVAKSLVKRLGDNKRLRKMIFSAHSLPGQHLTVAAFRVDIF